MIKYFSKLESRNLYILKSFSASFLARIIGLITTVVITPLLLKYLGEEQFGIWSIIIGFSAYLSFADFGLSNGLLNFLLKHKNNSGITKKAISTTFIFLNLTSVFLIILFGILSYYFNWNSFFDTEISSLNAMFTLVVFIYLANIPLLIIQKIEFAYLHNHVYHFWEVFQKLIIVIGIFVLVKFNFELIWFVIMYYLPVNISNLLNILFYSKTNKALNVSFILFREMKFDKPIFKSIFKIGILFLMMNLTYVLGRSLDKLILGHWGSLEMVTYYEIMLKPFELVLVFIMMLTSTLWSAFGDAIYNNDHKWIGNIIKKSVLIIIGCFFVLILFMYFFGNQILELWLGNLYSFSSNYYLLLGVWTLLLALTNVLGALFNAGNILKFQIITFLAYAIVSVVLKITGLTKYGLMGFIIMNIFAFTFTILVPWFWKYRKYGLSKHSYES